MGVVDLAARKDEHIAKPPAPKASAPKKPAKREASEGRLELAMVEFVEPPLAATLNIFTLSPWPERPWSVRPGVFHWRQRRDHAEGQPLCSPCGLTS